MAVEISAGSELAQRLQNVVGPKLVEIGWSSGLQDDTLSEYIILMLANGKSREEIASDLAKDLLDLGDEDQSAVDFSRWLFEQVDILNQQTNGAPTLSAAATSFVPQNGPLNTSSDTPDAEMGDANETSERKIPTGPKAMRNGSGGGNGRGGPRLFNNINKAMDRSGDSLHRVQGNGGIGRTNSHTAGGRGGRGNKGQQIQRNFDGANRRAMQNPGMGAGNGFGFPGQAGNNQNAQAQFLQMMEEHARMMTQLASQQGFMTPNFPQMGQSNGKSLFDRTSKPGRGGRGGRNHNRQGRDGGDTAMGEDGPSHSAEGSEEQRDAAHTLCKFNLYCTKPDCQFAHQSPAAPPGQSLDFDTECTYGVACKNHKCVGRHPSPAKKFEHQAQQECKFGPQCQNPTCSFKHSTAPMCRNGGDCTTPGCTFFHSSIECKFNPCTNTRCIYKHKEGQKGQKPGPSANVWTPGGENKEHISERKFINEGEAEEVIIPGGSTPGMSVETEATTA